MTSDSSVVKIEINTPILKMADIPPLTDIDNILRLEIWFGPTVFWNSTGIRDWIQWIAPLADKRNVKIFLYTCPETVIYLINMVSDFSPRNAEVNSFYVPFFSDKTSETKRVLLRRGTDFTGDKVKLPEVLDQNGTIMQIDVIEKKYFKFLKSSISSK